MKPMRVTAPEAAGLAAALPLGWAELTELAGALAEAGAEPTELAGALAEAAAEGLVAAALTLTAAELGGGEVAAWPPQAARRTARIGSNLRVLTSTILNSLARIGNRSYGVQEPRSPRR